MSHTILVVDDTKFMRKMLTDMLKQFGYKVVGEADNGRQAVQKFNELRPDVVMMDITMPEMDGIEAMREIRRIDPASIVLICSAMSQQDLISDALKAGANGYVMKPFKPNRVHEVIRKNVVSKIQVVPPDEEPAREPVQPAVAEPEQPVEYAVPEPLQNAEEEAPLEAGGLPVEQSVEPLPGPLTPVLEKRGDNIGDVLSLEENETAESIPPAEAESVSYPSEDETETPEILERQEAEPAEEEWSLEDLNELSLIMDDLEESEISTLSSSVSICAPAEAKEPKQEVLSPKIIPIIRGGTNVKKFTSSYMCNWAEDMSGKMMTYLVICTESENRVCLEVSGDNQEKQKIEVSLEGFRQLISWMEDKLSTGSNVRDLSRKSEV
ncbi:MAG: response regulator [Paenibacillaceae bacterium]|jgi:DNA-binding NarL/FixJ family response regulator|nr:response regulator [Paenibacillaceae bacterium]